MYFEYLSIFLFVPKNLSHHWNELILEALWRSQLGFSTLLKEKCELWQTIVLFLWSTYDPVSL